MIASSHEFFIADLPMSDVREMIDYKCINEGNKQQPTIED